ncbi:DUF4157 domain-containing protein [Pedobacter sp. B4-66]|uniref:eCIS core domain-containing protein n=1 Tax=Pedobacter sp. B4-66 TaxID=2817280 RepID=UPI001BD9EA8D|nr:DUF4157 domain-containing protein [Pedobacter sp. B4-66]
MSYNSRVYRLRNAHVHDEIKPKPFFTRQSVQRLATPAEDEKLGTNDARMAKDKEIQEKPIQAAEEEKKDEEKSNSSAVQAKVEGNGGTVSPQVTARIENSAGKGSPLPKGVLHEMNTSFGIDFSNVRIHNDGEAVSMNKKLHAQAFTHGNDIYFNEGKFDPGSVKGKFLLAHELTHVVQQNDGKNTGGQIRRDPIPADLKLPCKWGDYFFEEYKIGGIRILIGMAEADRKSIAPVKDIAARIEADNKTIPNEVFKVKTCIISPNTTRFALFKGEPVLVIDPADANVGTVSHEMGHAVFHYLNNNKEAKINKSLKTEDWILNLTDIFLQLRDINLQKDKDNQITANFIVDPTEWDPGAKAEHPTDVDEFFASAKEAFHANKKALEDTFAKYGKQNKKVVELGNRLIALLSFLFANKKIEMKSVTTGKDVLNEQLKKLSEPSKVEDTIAIHELTVKLINPDERKKCK